MSDTDCTIRLHLINNSTLDMTVAEGDVEEAIRELGEVIVNPGAIFTIERPGGGAMHVPSLSLLLYEVLPE